MIRAVARRGEVVDGGRGRIGILVGGRWVGLALLSSKSREGVDGREEGENEGWVLAIDDEVHVNSSINATSETRKSASLRREAVTNAREQHQ